MHGGVMETIKVDPEQEQEGSTRGPMSKRFWFVPKDKAGIVRCGSTTRAPYGLEIVESCLNCPHHEERLFCNLSPAALKHLETITAAASYPKGATLFVEGQKPRGVFILCNGRAAGLLPFHKECGPTLCGRAEAPRRVHSLQWTRKAVNF